MKPSKDLYADDKFRELFEQIEELKSTMTKVEECAKDLRSRMGMLHTALDLARYRAERGYE
jgi:hypothetical protein